MKWKIKFNISMLVYIMISVMFGCASTDGIVGKWQRIGDKDILEFKDDGTFIIVDNMDTTSGGTYVLQEPDKIILSIKYTDIPAGFTNPLDTPEHAEANIHIQNDLLELVYPAEVGADEIERFRRIK